MAAVTFERVTKTYADGTTAVNGLDLGIADGEFVVLVGPSGCGKTTALRMVAGLEEISGGVMRIGERVVNHVPSRDRDIAMVFQSYALYPHLSVYDNIAFGLRVKKVPKAEIERRVENAAKILGLDPFLHRKPRALSGGQRQRVAMGRAIVREPAAFLMDEPLSNLDAKLRVQMRAEIAGLQRDLGVTTLYVTHDQVEAMTMGDRVAVMRKGELQQVADPQTLYDRPVNLFVGGFIGSPAMNMVEATLEQQNGGYVAKLGDQPLALSAGDASGAPGPRRLRRPHGHPRHPARGSRGRRARDRHAGRSPAARHDRADRGARLGDHGALHDPGEARRHRGRAGARRGCRGRSCGRRAGRRGSGDVRRSVRAQVDCTCRADARGRGRHPQPPFLRSRLWPRDLRRDSDERSSTVKKHHVIGAAIVAMVLPLVLIGAAAGRSAKSGAAASGSARAAGVSGTVTFDGVWTGSEAASFGKVIKAFNKVYPNVKIKYNPLGNNVSTVLSTSIAGGHPPDMADIAQPGYVKQLVQQGHLKPITYALRRSGRTSRRAGSRSAPSAASSTRSSSRPRTSRCSGTTCPPSRRPG